MYSIPLRYTDWKIVKLVGWGGFFLGKNPLRPLNMLIFNFKIISKCNISIEPPNISVFFAPLTFLVLKKWQISHLVEPKSNWSTFKYDLDLSGQIIKVLNLNWLILVTLSYVWVLTSIYITFELSFKLLDHFQQCVWNFSQVTFIQIYQTCGVVTMKENNLKKEYYFSDNTPPNCFTKWQQ